MLLIITNKTDLTSDFLILRMKERGVTFRRLNTEDYGKSFVVDIYTSDMGMCYNVSFSNDVEMGEEDIGAVYFRQPLAPEVPNDIIPEDRGFHLRESKEILRSLWRLIDARKWINHPKNLWLASNKIEQLDLAQRIGFDIPKTCVSTSKHIIEKFMKSCGMSVVCKAVKHGFLRETNGVRLAMTQRVGAEFLEYIGSYAPTPMIFQEEIRKSYDIRITVIGQTVFATAIHSQDYKETEVDWRHWDVSNVDLVHRPIKLPKMWNICVAA